VNPSLSIEPGFKFWISTSAVPISFSSSARPSWVARSITTESLPRLSQTK
jgi:hypothetical protein